MQNQDDPAKPDRLKSKSSLSLLWEEFCGGPIDLQSYVENCWNSMLAMEIDIEQPKPDSQNSGPMEGTPVAAAACKREASLAEEEDVEEPPLAVAAVGTKSTSPGKDKDSKDSGNSSLHDEDHLEPLAAPQPSIASRRQRSNDVDKWSLVVKEMIETERAYLSSLKEVEEGYMDTFSFRLQDGEDDLKIIFSNWKELRKFHFSFLTELQIIFSVGFEGLIKLSRLFLRLSGQFERLYTQYCINYIRSINHLNHIETADNDAWQYLAQCQSDLGHALPLSTFLLKPVQRILKYQLLLRELVQSCRLHQPMAGSPAAGAVVAAVLQALQEMVAVAGRINDRQTAQEERTRLLQLYYQLLPPAPWTPSRWGPPCLWAQMRATGRKNPRTALLCEAALVVAKPIQAAARFHLSCTIECGSMMLFECIPKQPLGFHVLDIKNARNKITLLAGCEAEKELWCTKIKQLILSTYEDNLISERNRKILLDKKQNVLSMQATPSKVKSVYPGSDNDEKEDEDEHLLDLESSIREILQLDLPLYDTTRAQLPLLRQQQQQRQKQQQLCPQTPDFKDPSVDVRSTNATMLRSSRQGDTVARHANEDYRSVLYEVNEEMIRGQATATVGGDSVHQTYLRYIELSRQKPQITARDVADILHGPDKAPEPKQSLAAEEVADIETLQMCSDDQESLDSNSEFALSSASGAASAVDTGQRRAKSSSMDRNMGLSVLAGPGRILKQQPCSSSGSEKRSLFSSVRGLRSHRSNSEWSSISACAAAAAVSAHHSHSSEIRPGLVKSLSKLFRVPSNRKERGLPYRVPPATYLQHEEAAMATAGSVINKSTSSQQIGRSASSVSDCTTPVRYAIPLKPRAPAVPIPVKPPRRNTVTHQRSSSTKRALSATRPTNTTTTSSEDSNQQQPVRQLVGIFQAAK